MVVRRSLVLSGLVAVLAVAGFGPAMAQAPAPGVRMLHAHLTNTQEVPPVKTVAIGSGWGTVTYDPASKRMTYTLSWMNLTGPATAAHFHGPAYAGTNAAVVLPIGSGTNPPNPVSGEAILTDAQAADLLAGKWYMNIHTANHPAGEVRGQVIW